MAAGPVHCWNCGRFMSVIMNAEWMFCFEYICVRCDVKCARTKPVPVEEPTSSPPCPDNL